MAMILMFAWYGGISLIFMIGIWFVRRNTLMRKERVMSNSKHYDKHGA